MCDNKLDPRFYPEVYQAVAGKDYTVYAYMNDGSVRKFDVKPLIKKGGVFKKIEDKEIFKNTLTVLNGTVAWVKFIIEHFIYSLSPVLVYCYHFR